MAGALALTKSFALPDIGPAQEAPSDRTLLQSIAAGDQPALRILFARHNLRIFRFRMRLVDGEATAEDLVSEVSLEVWRKAGQFEARSQVSAWLLVIVQSLARPGSNITGFTNFNNARRKSVLKS